MLLFSCAKFDISTLFFNFSLKVSTSSKNFNPVKDEETNKSYIRISYCDPYGEWK